MRSLRTSRPEPGKAPVCSGVLSFIAILFAPCGAAVVAQEASAAPPEAPPPQFTLCATCHSTSADGTNSMGPNLRGVVGRKAGTAPGFQYSQAMKGSGIRWTPQELDSFLTDVPKKVPGTLMPINGLPDAQDRQAVINYLKSLK
jgi:cytochrome c